MRKKMLFTLPKDPEERTITLLFYRTLLHYGYYMESDIYLVLGDLVQSEIRRVRNTASFPPFREKYTFKGLTLDLLTEKYKQKVLSYPITHKEEIERLGIFIGEPLDYYPPSPNNITLQAIDILTIPFWMRYVSQLNRTVSILLFPQTGYKDIIKVRVNRKFANLLLDISGGNLDSLKNEYKDIYPLGLYIKLVEEVFGENAADSLRNTIERHLYGGTETTFRIGKEIFSRSTEYILQAILKSVETKRFRALKECHTLIKARLKELLNYQYFKDLVLSYEAKKTLEGL